MVPLCNRHPLSLHHARLTLLISYSSSLSLCSCLFFCFMLCWIPADVLWWSVMPWGQTPLWRIVWWRELWLFTPRRDCQVQMEKPPKQHQYLTCLRSARGDSFTRWQGLGTVVETCESVYTAVLLRALLDCWPVKLFKWANLHFSQGYELISTTGCQFAW